MRSSIARPMRRPALGQTSMSCTLSKGTNIMRPSKTQRRLLRKARRQQALTKHQVLAVNSTSNAPTSRGTVLSPNLKLRMVHALYAGGWTRAARGSYPSGSNGGH